MKLKALQKEVSPDMYHEALLFLNDYAYKNKKGIKEIIYQAAITAHYTNFPPGDTFNKLYYWIEAYLDTELNFKQLEKCVKSVIDSLIDEGMSENTINEQFEGQDMYEIMCFDCEDHDSCHKT